MRMLKLRQYDRIAAGLAQCRHRYSESGYVARLSTPPEAAVLQEFYSPCGFRILIDLRLWFEAHYEDRSEMAVSLYSSEDIRNLFAYSSDDCALITPDDEYLRLISSGVKAPVLPVDLSQLAGVPTTLGQGWVTEAPVKMKALNPHRPASFVPVQVPFLVSAVMGKSVIRARLLRKIKVGDVLLITQPCALVRADRHLLGKFYNSEETIVFEEIDAEENAYLMNEEAQNTLTDVAGSGLDNLAVKLDFVIAEQVMSFGELSKLTSGDVIALLQEGYHSITVRGNGTLIARGELMYVDDKLCVEIQTLYNGADDGK